MHQKIDEQEVIYDDFLTDYNAPIVSLKRQNAGKKPKTKYKIVVQHSQDVIDHFFGGSLKI